MLDTAFTYGIVNAANWQRVSEACHYCTRAIINCRTNGSEQIMNKLRVFCSKMIHDHHGYNNNFDEWIIITMIKTCIQKMSQNSLITYYYYYCRRHFNSRTNEEENCKKPRDLHYILIFVWRNTHVSQQICPKKNIMFNIEIWRFSLFYRCYHYQLLPQSSTN